MVLCDGAHRDPGTGKFFLLGTFANLYAASFPTQLQAVVYFALSDCLGQHNLTVRMVDANSIISGDTESEPIFTIELPVESNDPVGVLEGAVGFMTEVPGVGVFEFELRSGDTFLMSRKLSVQYPPNMPKPDEGQS